MHFHFFDNRRVRQALTLVSLAGALAAIFPPRHRAFEWWAEHAVAVAIGFLLLGIFFLTINKSRLMFVCLGCSAAISFFKNEISEFTPPTKTLLPFSQPLDTPDHLKPAPIPQKQNLSDESPETR